MPWKMPSPTSQLALILTLMLAKYVHHGGSGFASAASSTLPRDVMAVKAFKEAVFDPHGMLAGWMGDDPCTENWTYIDCSDAHRNRTIIQLSLANLQLKGEIPSSLQNLEDLKSLDLGNNDFYGQLPGWIGNLTKLVALDLQSNELSGELPRDLGRLNKLVFLRVTNNSLTGQFPDEFGNLSSLKILACENNFLNGTMPSSMKKLTSISHLHMDHNKFTGALPDWLGHLSELVHLFMNDNLILGPLPSELGNCSKLQQLKLDNNLIAGSIPATFGLLTTLTDLRMQSNSLSEYIPSSFNNLISLHVLDLGFNDLQGSIPKNLGDLDALVFLNLQGNNLSRDIPASLAHLSNIEIISLGENRLTGAIPDLGLSNNLLLLELENNLLTGAIPPSLRRPGLNLVLDGNPLCSDAINRGIPACFPHHSNSTGLAPPTCSCPLGMILRSLYTETMQCDCVAPLLIELFFPRVLFQRCTKQMRETLGRNLARELYLEIWQVIVKSAVQNSTGTDAMFLIMPMTGVSLDSPTLTRIKTKLNAPYLLAVWFDGEFGWFNYVVLHFIILPLSPGGIDLAPSQIFDHSSSKRKASTLGAVLITAGNIIGGLGVLLALISLLVFFWRRHLRRRETHHGYQSSHNIELFDDIELDQVFRGSSSTAPTEEPALLAKVFTMEELSTAANNFCSENLIGTGGFGAVYRGILPDGTAVAIKKLSGPTKQGEEVFQNEIQMIGHRLGSSYLMQLLGYCAQEDERVLVYKFMPHGSLLDYLKGGRGESPILFLNWKTRIQIALDSAKGLRYLHELHPPVVHRDIKPSNILLDENFNAKVADFGLSKLFPLTGSSPVMTRVVGTFGYLAPDYSITGMLTVKSDIYSFGVVLLELLSGQNVTFLNNAGVIEFLIPWAKPLLKEKTKRSLVVDLDLRDECPAKAVELMAGLILSCLDLDPDRRPTMVTVQTILAVIFDIPTKT